MKAVVLTGIRQMELVDVPMPKIEKDTDVLLKIEMVGVCGSDVHYYETGKIGSQVVEYPFIVGHECAATVTATGGAVKRVKEGDRIVVDPAIACQQCDQCLTGRENTCRSLKFLGCPGQVEGCLSEYIVMPEQSCFPISQKFSFERAVLCEPLAIGYYAVKQANLKSGHNIAVLGAGPIGLSCMVSAGVEKVSGCYVTEKIEERVKVAADNGATWVGNPVKQDIVSEILKQQPGGLDVVFECAGQQETLDNAVNLLKPGGKLMLIGIPRADRVTFHIDKIRRNEITIINVRRQNHCTGACIDLIEAGKLNVDFMVTHRFSLDQTQQAFDIVAEYRDGVVKALIEL
ncbi:MAG: zinc-dependent alcohol dehydrogenase [Planctomycetota bacterium]|jgi:L-iditol 2-dehydrogenase